MGPWCPFLFISVNFSIHVTYVTFSLFSMQLPRPPWRGIPPLFYICHSISNNSPFIGNFSFLTSPQLLCPLSNEKHLNFTIKHKFTKQPFNNNTKQWQGLGEWRASGRCQAGVLRCLRMISTGAGWSSGTGRRLRSLRQASGSCGASSLRQGCWGMVGEVVGDSGMTWRVTARFNSARVRPSGFF